MNKILTSHAHWANKLIGLWVLVLTCAFSVSAQNENDLVEDSVIHLESEEALVWDMSFAFKTMNIFRGLVPSRAPVFSTQAGVKYNSWILGFYGGSSVDGGYIETDLILIYYKPRFNAHLEWYYNFTEGITNIPTPSGFFDLDPEVTRGLLDLIVNYDLNKHFKFTSSTFLYGRDRPPLPEDVANGILLRRGEQRYTQYFAMYYHWYWDNTKVSAHVGGSFSWNDPSGATFYGDKPGFNDIGITFYHKLFDTKSFSIPIKASVTVNPLSNNVYLAAGIQLLEISKVK